MHRVEDPADPCRCKAAAQEGQCFDRAEDGSDYCLAHHGVDRSAAKNMRRYLLTRAEDRARYEAHLSTHDNVKSLRDETAIAMMLLERMVNMVHSDSELLARSGSINALLLTVERLQKSSILVEKSLGALLSRDSAIGMAQQLVQIAVDELQDIPGWEEIAQNIVHRFEQVFRGTTAGPPLALTDGRDPLES